MARKDHSGRTFHQDAPLLSKQGRCAYGRASARGSPRSSPLRAGTATAHEPWVTEFNDGVLLNVGRVGHRTRGRRQPLVHPGRLNTFGRITPSAVVTDFPGGLFGGGPRGIAAGPDGNVWVAQAGGDGAIARVTPGGFVTEFDVGLTPGDPWDITAGPDGNLWFVDRSPAVIGRITTEGVDHRVHRRPQLGQRAQRDHRRARTARSGSRRRTAGGSAGHDGRRDHGVQLGPVRLRRAHGHHHRPRRRALVHAERRPGRDRPHHEDRRRDRCSRTGSRPTRARSGIAKGPDGALWFTESASPGRIGRITTSGRDHRVHRRAHRRRLAPWLIAPGPDGNMWFTENALLGRVARITLPPVLRALSASDVGRPPRCSARRVRPELPGHRLPLRVREDHGLRPGDRAGHTSGTATTRDSSSEQVEGLEPATEYHFRVVATNDSGTSYGPDKLFKTLPLPVLEPATSSRSPTPLRARARARREARVRQDGRRGAGGQRAREGAGRRLADAGAGRRAAGGGELRHASRRGGADERGLPRRPPDRQVRRRALHAPPAARGLRARGRLSARRELRRLPRAGHRASGRRAVGLAVAPRPPALGPRPTAAASGRTAATARRRCAARAG